MRDTTIKKISSKHSPHGEMGQKYLVSGKNISMRLWEAEEPTEAKATAHRKYETVGYVIKGRAELQIEEQTILLEPGDSWLVPPSADHTYKILEPFTAIEVTSPPARIHARDEKST